jgi:hypothetical protein
VDNQNENTILVHGRVNGTLHAWVEFTNAQGIYVWEPQSGITFEMEEFAEIFVPVEHERYGQTKALTLALKAKHYGPW